VTRRYFDAFLLPPPMGRSPTLARATQKVSTRPSFHRPKPVRRDRALTFENPPQNPRASVIRSARPSSTLASSKSDSSFWAAAIALELSPARNSSLEAPPRILSDGWQRRVAHVRWNGDRGPRGAAKSACETAFREIADLPAADRAQVLRKTRWLPSPSSFTSWAVGEPVADDSRSGCATRCPRRLSVAPTGIDTVFTGTVVNPSSSEISRASGKSLGQDDARGETLQIVSASVNAVHLRSLPRGFGSRAPPHVVAREVTDRSAISECARERLTHRAAS